MAVGYSKNKQSLRNYSNIPQWDPWAPGREVTWSSIGGAVLVKTEPGK